MKNAILLHEFCEYYNIPEKVYDEVHRMDNDQLALLIFSLLKRIDNLEDELHKTRFPHYL